ncbi:MAG: hypothetical protein ACK4Z8_00770 [Novosphingobium sp.]
MIEFPPTFPDVHLLKKAVRWTVRHRYHIPSLTELAPKKSLAELTATGRAWQKAGLGTMIEQSEEGRRSVHFSLNDQAVFEVNRLNQQSIVGRVQSVNLSNWIALSALVVSIIALFKPGS